MRLEESYREHLKAHILSLRSGAIVYLFGSRTDMEKRGGDIDILVLCEPVLSLQEEAAVKFEFWKKFGEQKIDIACFTPSDQNPFKKLALSQAIPL